VELNLAVVCGPLSGAPELRSVASGARVASFAIRTHPGERATSVPVSWWDPPTWAEDLAAGDELLVLGAVRRRFFRAASGTGSRVEVEAAFVSRPGSRQRATLRRRVDVGLDALDR
jgi:single-strand DNA-binding protein